MHNLRYARNSEILTKAFDRVVATLQAIEQEYRTHGAEFVTRANKYPIDASAMYSKYSIKMCQHLGVIPPESVSAAKENFDAEASSNDTESSETLISS